MATKKSNAAVDVEVMEVSRGEIEFCVKGASPIILNKLSEKVKRELLLPKGRKTATEKAGSLKHNPYAEFRSSAHWVAPGSDTLLAIQTTAFKGAMMTAALDMEGLTKASVGRHVYVTGDYVGIYGVPKLLMSAVRSADMNKTPDIRTRVIVPEWAAKVRVRFVKPLMRDKIVANLMAAAGIISGVGDFRPEKGKGAYGQFELVSADDAEHKRITKEGKRGVQVSAMNSPEMYDEDTADLMAWWVDEAKNRGWDVSVDGTAAKV